MNLPILIPYRHLQSQRSDNSLLALEIILAIALVCFLIGRIRIVADFSYSNGNAELSLKCLGFRINLASGKRRKQKAETSNAAAEANEKNRPGKIKKKKRRFYKIDIYDIREMLSRVAAGLRKLGKGFDVYRLNVDFTAAGFNPYDAARIYSFANALLSVLASAVAENCSCTPDIRTALDFDDVLPRLGLGIRISFRIGAAFALLNTALFGVLWVFIKIIFRFAYLYLFDRDEYDFRMHCQAGPIKYFRERIYA